MCVSKIKMCGDHKCSFSEEFSKVQEESIDKVFEISNQPEKTGEIEVHTQVVTHNLIYFSIFVL